MASTQWRGEYYPNPSVSGSSAMVRDEGGGALSLAWGTGSPNAVCGVPADNFSACLVREVYFDPGVYRFTATSDDGVQILVDGATVVNGWWDHGLQSFSADRTLTGWHTVQVLYYDRTGDATLNVGWQWLSPPPQPPGTLYPGQRLYPNQSITSPDGRFTLVYQDDGNLVMYTWYGWAAWASNTSGNGVWGLEMQWDGNLVMYDDGGHAVWSTGTWGNNGAYLAMQNDGNIVVYNVYGVPLWSSGTGWW